MTKNKQYHKIIRSPTVQERKSDGKKARKNILLIGFGPHAKRIYFPLIQKFSEEKGFELVMAVDLVEKKSDIQSYLKEKKAEVEILLIPPEHMTYDTLHPEVEAKLDVIVKEKDIEGVIIATEPLVHVMYAKWALKNDLSILMDKPISTYRDVSTDQELAKRLIKDFDALDMMYTEARRRKPGLTFSLMAQRRFHPAFQKVKGLIAECHAKTGCPVTSIQTFHCDGQWRMPTEIVEQLYHPYMQGYGKCSHSGYHFFDIVPFLLEAGLTKDKGYDNIDVFSSFVRPLDFMQQLSLQDYEKLFGKERFNVHNKYDQEQLNHVMRKHGEVDAFSNICFRKGDKVMTLATINLAHNGFARRHWVTAEGKDLYKGNGRVRHEFHILEQGPFQSIHYHSYQSKEVDPSLLDGIYEVGGEYHLEIYVFRNTEMIGGRPVEVLSIRDLNRNIMGGKSRGHQEDARAKGFLEFIDSLNGHITRKQMVSEFSTHRAAAVITSGIYQSACAQMAGMNPKINLPFRLEGEGGVKYGKGIDSKLRRAEQVRERHPDTVAEEILTG